MRITYLHQHFRTPGENGGVRSYHLARALASRGHDVHIVAADHDPVPHQGYTVEAVDGLHVHRVPVPYDNAMGPRRRIVAFARFALRSASVARRLRGDVVIATSTPLTVALPGLWAVMGRKVPFVFEVRDLWPEVPIAMGYLRRPAAALTARLLERLAYRNADRIVALSEGMADGVVKAGGAAHKVVVVPNISDVETFQAPDPTETTVLDRIPALAGRPIVLYCGTFGRANGLAYMVELAQAAARQGSPVAFVAVGKGAEYDQVVRLAERLGVWQSSFFALPPVSKNELPALLARATFGSSWWIDVAELEHNSANKFFDTLAAGRPVLINHGGWQADVLSESGAGWSLSRDADDAIRQLTDILEGDGCVDRAGAAALELAEREFSLELLARRFVTTVEGVEILPRARGRRHRTCVGGSAQAPRRQVDQEARRPYTERPRREDAGTNDPQLKSV
ncbi:glycosyltransferase family 4 protein [Frigoribacterium sp. Leaf186]|uniref:glycosyltransferase family 4 protein n=1 Tax=Frigoribacterium sp. Leaf186 TaxID=1736293 RepID=UPI0007009D3D|nr:glycosyltransferase family 4 protein [Frigoribacterium sp. Leaf186]KQS22561.1 hypothetical protein ASG05_03105 [Frigoribacterium sp. Leaf186]